MNRAALLLLGLLLAACRGEAPVRVEDDASDVELASPAEADPLAAVQDGPDEPGGEPGVPGSPAPEATYRAGEGRCFVYPAWVAIVRPRSGGAGGEDIVVAARAPGSDARALCTTPPAEPAVSITDPTAPTAFFGLVEGLLLVDVGLGSAGRALRVLDLSSGEAVLDARYEEPVLIEDGTLEFGEPVGVHRTLEEVVETGVNCPDATAWLEDGFGVAVNRQTRFHLADRRRDVGSDLYCAPAQ